MHRTTIYLESDLETQIKAEARRRGLPMAEFIREAVREKLIREQTVKTHRHAGAFASGHRDTSTRVDEVLEESGFGDR